MFFKYIIKMLQKYFWKRETLSENVIIALWKAL